MTQQAVKAYALTLPHRIDRQRHLVRQLRRVGFDYQVVWGPSPSEADGFTSPGRRGCYEGHLAMFERAAEERPEIAVFIEDDVLLPLGFSRVWRSICTTLATQQWEFLHLSYIDRFYPSEDAVLERLGPAVGRLNKPDLLTAALYAVHRDALDDLTQYFQDHRHTPPTWNAEGIVPRAGHDGTLNDWRRSRGIHPLVSLPNLAEQWRSASSIMDPNSGFGDALHHNALLRPLRLAHRAQFQARFELTTARRIRNGWPDHFAE